MQIHMYLLSSTMTGSCHVCWPHSLPLLLPPWQDLAMCPDHTVCHYYYLPDRIMPCVLTTQFAITITSLTGSCHVCWPHSLPLLLPPWQDHAMCADHTFAITITSLTGSCHVCWPHSLPLLLPPWQDHAMCADHTVCHYYYLPDSCTIFTLNSCHKHSAILHLILILPFTACCSKYSVPNIQFMWRFKGNWSGGLILLSYLSRSRLAIPNLTASSMLSESCKFRHLRWLPTPRHANDFWPVWLWGTIICVTAVSTVTQTVTWPSQHLSLSHSLGSTCGLALVQVRRCEFPLGTHKL
jgi:hypothetical protein